MDNFEFNQLLLATVLLFNIVVLIVESDFNIQMDACTEGNTLEAFICVIRNIYTWMFIVNIVYIIYVTRKIINYIILYQRRYMRQSDEPMV